jgi:hypothetical protein
MQIKEKPVLHLNLKKKWFDMILSGKKTEEYREMSEYWKRVFQDHSDRFKRLIKIKNSHHYPEDVIICFSNGYAKNRKQFFIECKNIRVGYGKEKWGAEKTEQYFILSLGKILKGEWK